jgi:hypothetical protein
MRRPSGRSLSLLQRTPESVDVTEVGGSGERKYHEHGLQPAAPECTAMDDERFRCQRELLKSNIHRQRRWRQVTAGDSLPHVLQDRVLHGGAQGQTSCRLPEPHETRALISADASYSAVSASTVLGSKRHEAPASLTIRRNLPD